MILSVTQQILHNVMHTKFTLCIQNVPEYLLYSVYIIYALLHSAHNKTIYKINELPINCCIKLKNVTCILASFENISFVMYSQI